MTEKLKLRLEIYANSIEDLRAAYQGLCIPIIKGSNDFAELKNGVTYDYSVGDVPKNDWYERYKELPA